MRRYCWKYICRLARQKTCLHFQLIRRPLSCSMVLAALTDPSKIPSQPMRIPDPSSLSAESLIRAGTVAMVKSACSVVTQAVSALIEHQEEYIDALQRLTKLLVMCKQALGNECQQDKIWDAILEVRSQVQESKEKSEELQYVLGCAERSLEAAGEAAHAAGADFAGHTASENLHLARSKVNSLNERLSKAQAELLNTESDTIQATAEYGKKAKEMKREELRKLKETETLDTKVNESTHVDVEGEENFEKL